MSHPAHPGPGAPHGDGTSTNGQPSRPLSYGQSDPDVKPPIRYNPTSADSDGPPLDPERLELGRRRVLHSLALAHRELSAAEMCKLLSAYRPGQRHQILEGLVDEDRIHIRLTCSTGRDIRFFAFYRLGSKALSIATTRRRRKGGAS